MSEQGNSWRVHLPLLASLVLLFCTCSLMVHFVVEGISPADRQSKFEMTDQGGPSQPIQDNCADDLVYSSPDDSDIEYTPTAQFSQVPVNFRSILIAPLLPPPNS